MTIAEISQLERVARAIHGAKMPSHNPDCLYEHHEWDKWPVDDRREYADPFTGQPRVQLFHKAWRHYEEAARAAIAAMQGEPVAWMYKRYGRCHVSLMRVTSPRDAFWGWIETPLYALLPAPTGEVG